MEACIQKNNFNEAKCQQQVSHVSKDMDVLYRILSADGIQIDALYECCNLFYQKNGDDASTVSCPKANLLRYVCLHSPHTRASREGSDRIITSASRCANERKGNNLESDWPHEA